jgi:hypothetical protein
VLIEIILASVKKTLGIDEAHTGFDEGIILHINSVFSILQQMGVGPEEGFSISDDSTIWTDYISDVSQLNFVKSYIYLKVRLLFDPPASSGAMESMNKLISELEWRLFIATDPIEETEENEEAMNDP